MGWINLRDGVSLCDRPQVNDLAVTTTHLTRDALDQLREADAVVNEELANHDLMRRISQVPVVLIPLPMDESIVREPSCPCLDSSSQTHIMHTTLRDTGRSLCEP